MAVYPELIDLLMKELAKLPGIGPRSAERIVFHLLRKPAAETESLAQLLRKTRLEMHFCEECHNLAQEKICEICKNPARDRRMICVVEDPKDVIAFEKTSSYKGLYHVLLGALSPLDGVGPAELKIRDLVRRIEKEKIEEVILATNSSTEGEATALYLDQILQPLKVKVTRIACGLPVGSHIEYTDQATLARALEGRTSF